MEMKYILYAKVHTTKEAGNTWTFKFQPVEGRFKKAAFFSITTSDPFQDMGTLDLPQAIGDVISLNVKEKNVQGTLPKGKKEAAA